MSKDEDQVKKDENAFAELNKSNQANIDPCLALTAPEDDRNACVLVLWLAFLLTERKNGNGNLFSKLELWVIVLSIPGLEFGLS
ncbi:hypothetical protein D5086_031263 [Populus alba]|uniref:Uncharacterized protein n=1 Tax=Populus alba TaxID=43335 RepID=A0ACC4ART0_POPAL